MKKCTKCGKEFPTTREYFVVDNRKLSGLGAECRICARKRGLDYFRRNREKFYENNRRWMRLNPDKKKAHERRKHLRKYNLTIEGYNKISKNQNGLCAICGKEEKVNRRGSTCLSIDHDHKTGEVRGLLCSRCNVALGLMNEDIKILKKAIIYLERNVQNEL